MERRIFLTAAAGLVPLTALAAAKLTLRERVLGTWRIVDAETVDVETGASTPWGGKPRPYSGIIVYQPNGWMSVHIGAARQPLRADASLGSVSDSEKIGWFDTWYGYYGKFEIDEAQSKVRHYVEGSMIAYETGVTLTRSIKMDGGLLTLTTENRAATAAGATFNRLTWRKL